MKCVICCMNSIDVISILFIILIVRLCVISMSIIVVIIMNVLFFGICFSVDGCMLC